MGFFCSVYIVNDMKTSDLNINSGCSNGSKGTPAELQFGHHCSTCGHLYTAKTKGLV